MAEKSSNTQNNQPTNSSGATSGNAASGTSNTSSINPTNVRQRAQSHNGTVSQSHRRLQSPAHNAPITTSSTPKSNRRQNRSSNEPVSQHRSVANVSNGRQERGATVNPNVAVNVAKERGDSEVDDILEPKEPSEHDPQNVDEVESSGSGPMNPLQELAVANSPAQNNLESGKVSEVVDQGATQEVPFNWQASKKTLKERMKFMFNNDIMADVYFIVGKGDHTQRIPAHKFILATGSAVFDAMFNGAMASYSLEEEIPDVEPSAFLALLRFLYSDEVIIDPETVMTTLYTAKKYAVPALEKACVDFLKQNLSSDNAFMLLTQARLFDEPQLASLCLETIDKNTTEALNAEGFTDIDLQTLCVVLERDTLGIRECKLFNAVCKWAEVECARKELPINNANKRECLGHALELIRFPLMTVEEFAQGPAQSSILTDREVVQLFLHFTVNPKPQVVFKDTPRCCLTGKEQVVSRFIQIENRWGYSGTSDRIRFQVNRKIFIVGFGLYGSIHGSAEYQCNIQVILTDSGKVCGQNDSNFQCDGSMTTFRVMFKEPVEILPNTTYTASATLKGPDSYYGTKGLRKVTHESVSSGKVTFAFSYAAGNNNGTSVEDGQLPEIIFYT